MIVSMAGFVWAAADLVPEHIEEEKSAKPEDGEDDLEDDVDSLVND